MAIRNQQEALLTNINTAQDTIVNTNNAAGGLDGNIFIGGTVATTCAISGKCFVSIQIITDAVFNSSAGGLTPVTAQLYMGDTSTSTDIDANGGTAIDGITFPAGTVLFGKWSSITLVSGSVVAYIGVE